MSTSRSAFNKSCARFLCQVNYSCYYTVVKPSFLALMRLFFFVCFTCRLLHQQMDSKAFQILLLFSIRHVFLDCIKNVQTEFGDCQSGHSHNFTFQQWCLLLISHGVHNLLVYQKGFPNWNRELSLKTLSVSQSTQIQQQELGGNLYWHQ